MMQAMPIARRALRTAVRGILLVGVTLAALEVGAWAMFQLRPQWPARDEVQATLAKGPPPETAFAGALGTELEPERQGNVLHPYIGFVRKKNPGGRNVVNDRPVDLPVNDYGFFGPSPLEPQLRDTLRIAITGGSVATELFLYGREALRTALEESGAYPGKRIEIVSLALGGMKQPQQLMALSYFLVLGASLDWVVNLDGFNEVALPLQQTLRLGLFPAYPNPWRLLASKRLELGAAELMGRISAQRAHRERWREVFSQAPLRHSSAALAVWNALRQNSISRENVLEAEMGKRLAGRKVSFQATGPPYPRATQHQLLVDAAKLWKRASIQMAQISRGAGLRYLHVLQPNQYVSGSKVLTDREREMAFGPPESTARIGVSRGYPLLKRARRELAARGVDFVDLTDLFREDDGRIYRDPCCHYTNRGYRVVARAIAEEIARRAPGAGP